MQVGTYLQHALAEFPHYFSWHYSCQQACGMINERPCSLAQLPLTPATFICADDPRPRRARDCSSRQCWLHQQSALSTPWLQVEKTYNVLRVVCNLTKPGLPRQAQASLSCSCGSSGIQLHGNIPEEEEPSLACTLYAVWAVQAWKRLVYCLLLFASIFPRWISQPGIVKTGRGGGGNYRNYALKLTRL